LGTVIQLQVATGLVVVPDVKGLSCQDATDKMKQKTLVATCQDQSDPDVPANQAIGSQPVAAGGTTAQNSPITILISTGPQQVTVPPVVGQLKNDAIHALQAVGLKAKIEPTIECLNASLDKTVKSQDPAGGAQVPEGTSVTLTVYKFKPNDPSCVSPPPT
jgi:serine/threonine-protein kinase